MIGKLALIAALAGSATGAAVVLADEPAPAPAPRVPAVRTATPTPGPPRLPASDVRIVKQAEDPAGGAPWAVRRFATRLENGTSAECHELGRIVDGRFGWVDPTGTFRASTAGSPFQLGDCRAPRGLQQVGATLLRFTTIDASSAPVDTVTFGATAPNVRTVEPADEPPLRPGADGLVLRIGRGQRGDALLTGSLVYADGHRTRFNDVHLPPTRGARPRDHTRFVAARAPDPAGGVPWGLVGARGTGGGVCLSPAGQIVGASIGVVDGGLGVFRPLPFMDPRCDDRRKPTKAFPMRIDTLISGAPQDSRGRIERRVDSPRIVFSGRVHPDVVSVTIRTPRDVRTLVPTSPAHAILAVYDGRFPGGKVTATARLKDGREVTRSLYVE